MPVVARLTFDNLGEAADIDRGLWPQGEPVGAHPSVTVALPRLLDELSALGLRATFFVEGWSAGVYPDALREIGAPAHALALHGWRHEPWSQLAPAREAELLARGLEAFAAVRVPAQAFRPPRGEPTASTAALLAAHGISGWSPLAGVAGTDGGPPLRPFE